MSKKKEELVSEAQDLEFDLARICNGRVCHEVANVRIMLSGIVRGEISNPEKIVHILERAIECLKKANPERKAA